MSHLNLPRSTAIVFELAQPNHQESVFSWNFYPKTHIADILETIGLTTEKLEETLQGGRRRTRSRVEWAVEYVAQAGALKRPSRGMAVITDIGIKLLADHPQDFHGKTCCTSQDFRIGTSEAVKPKKDEMHEKNPLAKTTLAATQAVHP
jgi:restriction endonuclease Mrr